MTSVRTEVGPSGEIACCGIDLALDAGRVEEAVTFAAEVLNRSGAACGSELIFAVDGKKYVANFGVAEGVAVYLSRGSLPAEGARAEAARGLVVELWRVLNAAEGGGGVLLGQYESAAEVMLYYYGESRERMKAAAGVDLARNEMGRGARVEEIA